MSAPPCTCRGIASYMLEAKPPLDIVVGAALPLVQLEYLYAISIVLLACQEIVLLLDTPSSTLSLYSGSVLTWLAADFEFSHSANNTHCAPVIFRDLRCRGLGHRGLPALGAPVRVPPPPAHPDIRGVRTATRVCVHCIVSAEHVRDQGLSSWSHGAMG